MLLYPLCQECLGFRKKKIIKNNIALRLEKSQGDCLLDCLIGGFECLINYRKSFFQLIFGDY
jgi:hypothetical protein